MDKLKNNRGSTLALTMLTILVLTILGQAIMLGSTVESRASQRYLYSTEAFWLADAGIHKTLWEFTQNSCHGFVQEGTAIACSSCSSCGGGNKTLAATLSTGDYDIVMDNDNTNVKSIGWWPGRTAANRIQRTVQLDSGSLFKYATFAKGKISIANGVKVDSYNSANGPYGGSNISHRGNVGSNDSSTTAIDLGNNGTIDGNVSTGPGGNVVMGNQASITGSISHNNNIYLPDVIVPATLTSLVSGGTLTINNNQTANLSGNYKYASVNLKNNSTLNIMGNTNLYLTSTTSLATGNNVTLKVNSGVKLTIYVNGTLQFSNNVLINNVEQKPTNLFIYSTYTGTNGVTFSNNNDTYAATYAPNTDVLINNNGNFYGSVVGKTIALSGSSNSYVHFDQVLGGTINVSTREWQEL